MTDLGHGSIELIEISKLKPAARNARTHSKHQIKQIANSIHRFGFNNPVLIDDENRILAGHGRVAAAKSLEMREVPCLRFNDMTDADKRAYALADNKLALNAGWDLEILVGELEDLMQLGFDVELTGFEHPEIDILIDDADQASPDPVRPEDDCPEPTSQPVTRPGDLWVMGRHGLVCGDAKDPAVVDVLMCPPSGPMRQKRGFS